ncbi:MAG: hypothetical protein GNW80_16755 [Asgard group archaeon]|nr:hypothetical protein [Asgard group archaeon]
MPVNISLDEPLEKLWEEHDRIAKEFDDYLLKIDHEEVSLKDMAIPEVSFLDLKEKIAHEILKDCHFCERRCKANRKEGKVGYCRLGEDSILSSAFLHTGEESVLVPSGTIFFAGCTFTCVFCQNSDISNSESSYNNI